jgi:hypothetical protein
VFFNSNANSNENKDTYPNSYDDQNPWSKSITNHHPYENENPDTYANQYLTTSYTYSNSVKNRILLFCS